MTKTILFELEDGENPRWKNPVWQPAAIDCADDLPLIFLKDTTEWQVVPWRMQCPLELANHGLKLPQLGVCLLESGEPMTVLHHSASTCFEGLQKGGLNELAAHLECDGYDGKAMSVFEACKFLLEWILDGYTEEQILKILKLRAIKKEKIKLSKEMDFALEHLDSIEKEMLVQNREKANTHEVERASFYDDWAALQSRFVDKEVAEALKKPMRSRGTAVKKALNKRYHSFTVPDYGEEWQRSTFRQLERLCPQGCQLYKDEKLQRWLVHHGDWGTRSRAWRLYGARGSLILILRWVWKNEMELKSGGTLLVADTPIAGLFSPRRGRAEDEAVAAAESAEVID